LIPVLRLFLDANVLFLGGYSSRSPVHDLFALARLGRCELVASGYAIEEARRNLAVKGPTGSLDAFDNALSQVTVVPEAGSSAMQQAIAAELSDVADVPILAAAIQCHADVLVTGDRRAFGRHFRTRLAGVEVLVLRDALRRVVGLPLSGS
jgi:predicted nucleic acid-binding protein